MILLVHYDEIALKGKKRGYFQHALRKQLERVFNPERTYIDNARYVCVIDDCDVEERAGKVFGASDVALAKRTETTLEAMKDAAANLLKDKEGTTMAAECTRGDKRLEYTSMDMARAIGDVAVDNGWDVDLDDPDVTVYAEVTTNHAYVYTDKFEGPGGLPIGTAGNVLCLLSGGIDSPVAAYRMMRRGCHVDFLHFNPYRDTETALEKKMDDVLSTLARYQGEVTAHFAPYAQYQVQATAPGQHDLVVFRNFMLRTAAAIAQRDGYEGIVIGDNLAQVASQTLGNLAAASVGIDLPIYRPLVSWDKENIIDEARRIGTYEASIAEYNDCCSIIADQPNTSVGVATMRDVLDDIDLDSIVTTTLDDVETVTVEERS
jgi:thiamine biosynthesis protein ThiI